MSQTVTTTIPATDPVQAVLSNLGQNLVADPKGTLKGAVVAFGAGLKSTPSTQGAAAAGAQFLVSMALSGPALEAQGWGQLGDAIMQLGNLL